MLHAGYADVLREGIVVAACSALDKGSVRSQLLLLVHGESFSAPTNALGRPLWWSPSLSPLSGF